GQATLGALAADAHYGELFHANRRRFEEKWGVQWQARGRRANGDYRRLVDGVRRTVSAELPAGASLLVVSRGDDEFLDLDGRFASHFPQADDGTYAGFYPPDSATAIDHLETLRRRGAGYLLVPGTSLWWLD